MKNSYAKLITLLLFFSILLGSAYWMYTTFVKDKPVITIQEQRTNFDRLKADSSIKAQQNYRK